MPLQCPKCARANGDGKLKCLYCGESLPQETVAHVNPKSVPKRLKKAGPKNYLVTLLPPEKGGMYPEAAVSPMALGRIKEKFSTDDYQFQQWLKSRGPKVLKSLPEKEKAEELAKELRQWNLRALSICTEDLNVIGHPFRSDSAQIDQDTWIFHGAENQQLPVNPKDALLIVRGRIKVEKDPTKSKKEDRKLFGEGGGSEFHHQDTQDYMLLNIFFKNETTPTLSIKSSNFDFTCLGAKTTGSSFININHLADSFKGMVSGLALDDSFKYITPILSDLKTAGLFDPTVRHFSGSSDYQNNEPQFDQHSRLVCYLFKEGISLPQ